MKSSKGSEFERKISKKLSLWWSNNERDDIFWRSQCSGGRATQRKKTGKTTANQEGDLTAMDPIGQPLIDFCSIELKCGYPEFTIEGILTRPRMKKPILATFLEQCEKETAGTNKFSWLIVRQNMRSEIIIFNGAFRTWLSFNGFRGWRKGDYLALKFERWNLTVLRLDDFLLLLGSEFKDRISERI